MSNYGREKGYIKFTKTGYMQFVRAFRKQYNDDLKTMLARVYRLHEQLAAIKGAGSSQKRLDAFDKAVTHNGFITARSGYSRYETVNVLEVGSDTMDLIKDEMFRGKNGALTKPRAMMFPKYTNKDVTFSVDCDGYGTLTFNGEGIDWSVDEGNRSWESARECLAYQAFATTLNAYKWKRGEGGRFERLDEYDIDAGNGWQVVANFGPKGEDLIRLDQKILEAQFKAMRKYRR